MKKINRKTLKEFEFFGWEQKKDYTFVDDPHTKTKNKPEIEFDLIHECVNFKNIDSLIYEEILLIAKTMKELKID